MPKAITQRAIPKASTDSLDYYKEALARSHLHISELERELTQWRSATTDPGLIQAYRDTISILKEGVYGYEKLLQEQQQFIDELLTSLQQRKKVVLPQPAQVAPASMRALRDSVQQLNDELYHKQVYYARDKDSLNKAW